MIDSSMNLLPRFIRIRYFSLKAAAGEQSYYLTTALTSALGVISDFVTQWLPLGAILFVVSIGSILFFHNRWKKHSMNSKPTKKQEFAIESNASLTLQSGLASIILGITLILGLIVDPTHGVLSKLESVSQAQDKTNDVLSRMDEALAVLMSGQAEINENLDELEETVEEGNQSLEQIKENTANTSQVLSDQTKVLNEISETASGAERSIVGMKHAMQFSTALELLDRAKEKADGSSQGQVRAMQVLLANGFNFTGESYSGVNLAGAVLPGINFEQAMLNMANIEGASLIRSNFDNVFMQFAFAQEADFSEASMSEVGGRMSDFRKASFINAEMTNANFYGADFRGADLRFANLSDTVLAFADLRDANLEGANLSGAFLKGAVLNGANLAGAKFNNTNFLGAIVDPEQLTDNQVSGLCRHVYTHRVDREEGMKIQLTEVYESSRFASGKEYDTLTRVWGSARHLASKALPACTNDGEGKYGFYATSKDGLHIHLHRRYLGNNGRRQYARDYLHSYVDRLEAIYAASNAFVLPKQRKAWLKELKRNSRNTKPTGAIKMSDDTLLLLLLENELLGRADIDWNYRASRFVKGTGQWPDFFPDDAHYSDLPIEKIALFEEWTKKRAGKIGNGFRSEGYYRYGKRYGDDKKSIQIRDLGRFREFGHVQSKDIRALLKTTVGEKANFLLTSTGLSKETPYYLAFIPQFDGKNFYIYPEEELEKKLQEYKGESWNYGFKTELVWRYSNPRVIEEANLALMDVEISSIRLIDPDKQLIAEVPYTGTAGENRSQ